MAPPPSPRRPWLHVLFLVFLGGVMGVVVGEIYIRAVTGYVTAETLGRDSLDYEGSVFARHVLVAKPKAPEDPNARWRINRHGYRGPEFAISKPDGTFRILFYGGSQVFDENPGGKDWPSRVGELLRAKGFDQVEALNLGIPGHASFDSVGRLFAEGHLFDPDMVVLLNAWNDMKNFASDQPLLRQLKPYVWVNPRLHYWNGLDRLLSETSQLYVQLRDRYVLWQLRLGREGRIQVDAPPFKVHAYGVRQYRLDFATFADLAHTLGARPVFILQPRLPAPDNDEQAKKRISYHYLNIDHPTLLQTFALTDRIQREVGAAKGVPVLDPGATMTGQAPYFLDHVHLTAEGSEKLAQLMADGLAPMIPPRPAPAPSAFEPQP